jgi:transketolase
MKRRELGLHYLQENPYHVKTFDQYPISFTREDIFHFCQQIRRDIVLSTFSAGSGHPGGSLSAADMMGVLWTSFLKHKPSLPSWEDRDYMIYSKGHVSPLIYSLYAETGYFDRTLLASFREFGSPLQGHPAKSKLDCVEVSTGSLGQGLSVAAGIAMGLKQDHKENHVFALCGDGESQEGQIWEAIMSSAHYHLDNLTLFFDYNNLEIDGWVEDVMGIAPIKEKFEAFNWHTIVIDGHNTDDIAKAIQTSLENKNRPTVIIGKTIKGKGVSFMENEADWHGKAPNEEQLNIALHDINREVDEWTN